MKTSFLLILAFLFSCFSVNISAQNYDIFKRDFIKARMLKVADWQLKNPQHEPNDWTNGAFYAGVFCGISNDKIKGFDDCADGFGQSNRLETGKTI